MYNEKLCELLENPYVVDILKIIYYNKDNQPPSHLLKNGRFNDYRNLN